MMTGIMAKCAEALPAKSEASRTIADLSWQTLTLGDVANIASAGGLIIALIGAFIAWRSYTDNLKDQARARMHELLRELLALEVAGIESQTGFIVFKFYAMEEIYIWAFENRPRLTGGIRQDDFNSWIETIKCHLDDDIAESKAYFMSKPQIFDVRFRKFVRNHYDIAEGE